MLLSKLPLSRSYKLLRTVVLVTTVVSLAVSVWAAFRFSSSYRVIRDIELDCINFQYRTGIIYTDCVGDFEGDYRFLVGTIVYPLVVLISLPAVFFGSRWALGYIFSRDPTHV